MEKNLFNIIHEDAALLVLNKPAGLVVNKSATALQGTLQDLLADYLCISPQDQSEFAARCGIVHRLDKNTSGVMLVAKTEISFEALKSQFSRRLVEKEYIALLDGILEEPRIEVNAPLGRNPVNRLRFAVVAEGREARTLFKKIAEFPEATLVGVWPKTGRTHQIRVHAAALGHPVVGDILYSSKKRLLFWKEHYNRLMLHAHKISFTHPNSGQKVSFVAELPIEFGKMT